MPTAIVHPIPALKDWRIFAGGTCAEEGKNSFQLETEKGLYHIDPVCFKNTLKHRGYIVTFADVKGKLNRGLWSWIDTKGQGFGFPQLCMPLMEAVRACRAHFDSIGE